MANRPPKQPKRQDIPEEERADYDAVIERMRGMFGAEGPYDPEQFFDVGEYFGALLNSPPMTAIAARMGTFVRTAGERANTYSHAQREFVDQVLSADWKTNVVQSIHVADAVGAGVRLEAIKALRYGHEDDLNDEERLLARYIRQAVSGTVDDETWDAMVERLGVRGVVEYTGFVLWLQWIIRMMQALNTSAPSDEEVDRIIADLEAGGTAGQDFASRLR
jgi:hypothetical protein